MNMNRISRLLGVVLLLSAFGLGQATLTQTTLSSAVTTTNGQIINLTSATGVTAGTTQLFIDGELMDVRALSGTIATVVRGSGGTRGATHANGATVYLGPSNYFSSYDRVGSCTSSKEVVLPVINVAKARIFDCRSSGQWIMLGDTGLAGGYPARSFCTGTVGTAETEFLNGAACSGATTATARQVMSTAGTLANLRVFSSAAVVGGASKDVLTVFKNGSSTALTCTIAAAGTTCNDAADSVAVAAGDVITFQFVTATADTAANVSASVEKY